MKVIVVLDKHDDRTIQSLESQTYQDWELVVSEKLTTDLDGDVVVYAHHGDVLMPECLETLVNSFEDDIQAVSGTTREYKYIDKDKYAVYKKPKAKVSSQIAFRKSDLIEIEWDNLDQALQKLQIKAIPDQIVQRFYPQDQIEKWEQKRKQRFRRQMKVSVIFGVRNRAKYAKRVLRSLLVQDLNREMYEIVIVDFDSEDDIENYVGLLKAKNIKHINTGTKNYSRAQALNIGIKNCTGDIVVLSEPDLLFPKYSLRLIKDYFIDNEKCALQIKQRNLEKLETAVIVGKTYSDYAGMLKTIKQREAIDVGAIAIEKSHLEQINGLNQKFEGESYELDDLYHRLNNLGLQIDQSEEVEALHMWHNTQHKFNGVGYFERLLDRSLKSNESQCSQSSWGILTNKRPRVLFMVSPDAWESGSICKNVAKFLEPHYAVDMTGRKGSLRGKASKKYDIVYTSDWRYPEFRKSTSKFIVGVNDFISWNDGVEFNAPTQQMLNRLQEFHGVAVSCKALGQIFAGYHDSVMYAPSGTDTQIFRPIDKAKRVSKKFTVGWVGKPEGDQTIEGYQEHIKPVCNQMDNVELFSAPGGQDKNGHLQMLGFYNAIDVLVQFNETSGDNKTILDAMACGVPVITTRAGDAQQIVDHGYNGLVIPRTEQDLEHSIEMLRDKPEMREKIGQAARETVLAEWDWRDVADNWKQLFDNILGVSK